MKSVVAQVVFYLFVISNVVFVEGQSSGNEFELEGTFKGNDDDEYSTAKCVPCENEDDMPDPYANIEGITCNEWNLVNKLTLANSDSCVRQRLLGVRYCGCKIPDEYKDLNCQCPSVRPRVRINSPLTGTQLDCEEAGYVGTPDGEKTCKLISDSCCSAPTTTDTTCSLCKVKGNLPLQDNLIILGRSDGKTCGDLGNQLVLGPQDCHAFNFNHTLDEAAYCECPDIKPRGTCSVCPPGQSIVNKAKKIRDLKDTIYEFTNYNPTCGDYDETAIYVTGRQTCTQLRVSAGRNECCEIVLPSQREIGSRIDTDNGAVFSAATLVTMTTATVVTAAGVTTTLLLP